jgi:23S rRNA pseudouridine2605 synthase
MQRAVGAALLLWNGVTVQERLQKILARAGISSRRAAEELITAGRVTVNGQVVTELGSKADPERDTITLDGKPVRPATRNVYILLHKPAGYVTTMKDPQGRPVVTDLLKGAKERLFPVGRLDYNTEGLLLLTNDGAWANTLAHPRHEVDKEYHVRVRGSVSPEQIASLASGVVLEDGPTAPARVGEIKSSDNNTWLSVVIHEGRFRQVRRMCEAVGLSVVRLKRVRYGSLALGDLKPGEYRVLSDSEARALAGGEPTSPLPVTEAVKRPGVPIGTQRRNEAGGRAVTGRRDERQRKPATEGAERPRRRSAAAGPVADKKHDPTHSTRQKRDHGTGQGTGETGHHRRPDRVREDGTGRPPRRKH